MTKFLSDKHHERFEKLVDKANNTESLEKLSLLYIIAGNDHLYRNSENIYNFAKETINKDTLENDIYSQSESDLLRLGFTLFNGFRNRITINDVFYSLAGDSAVLAINAIKFRHQIKG